MNSNFRPYLFSLLLLVGVVAPLATTAQAPISNVGGGSVDDRVTQLEHITRAQGDLLTQLQQQVSDQQRDIEYLRGQTQQNQYQLEQALKQEAEQRERQQGSSSSGGTELGVKSNDEPDLIGDENSDYNVAVSLALEKKQYDDALVAFANFIKRYPQSIYLPNANYWLGQLNYNKGKKDDAAAYFAYVVKKYPKSPKSPDAMLKVGSIMQEKGQNDKAKVIYQQLMKIYASSDAAKQAQKRLATL